MVLNALRAFLRILAFVVISLVTCLVLLLTRALGGSWAVLAKIMKVWRMLMAASLNLKITQHGHIPTDTCIVMSNHRSYTDILLHMTGVPVVFVAKASVRSWPIVGWASRILGVIFVERSSPKSRAQTRHDIRDRLERGANVLIYPEGTTHRGPEILDYRPGVFRIAAEEGFPIVCSAIEYRNQDIAWVGDDKFLPHFLRTFGAPKLEVSIAFSSPFKNSDAEALRQQVMDWTQARLLEFRKAFDQPA